MEIHNHVEPWVTDEKVDHGQDERAAVFKQNPVNPVKPDAIYRVAIDLEDLDEEERNVYHEVLNNRIDLEKPMRKFSSAEYIYLDLCLSFKIMYFFFGSTAWV